MGILSKLSNIFKKEEAPQAMAEDKVTNPIELEIDEEDKVVVALAASIMASEDKPNSYFHISKITRIK
ncbi:hypothetical protein SAMN05444401_3826 [Clostridium amylolyticum]|uniref:Uncharacterized protein n=1 Tax=Clostridium amylolyticum TaxID=1121298 RepID=A0A1M6LY20_9CLOT|nr:hypothetical protein [Clostridium amylolyticum]SHJ76060.1 hypothetical protein SAMN05444401_3826 [Clostridium amylolyticum]